MAQWVEQQQKQRATWKVRETGRKATECDLEAEVEADAVPRDKDRLTTKVKTLEREAAQRATAPRRRAPGPMVEEEAGGWTAERGPGAPNAACARFLLAVAQAWRAQARAAADRCRLLPRACAWPCCRACPSVEVSIVAPDLAKFIAAHD